MKNNEELLRAEVRRLSARLDQRPMQAMTPAYQQRTIVIIGGNTLVTGQAGTLYKSTEVASVPSAYNPNIAATFIDGIGRGTLYINSVAQTDKVLLVNDTRGSFGAALLIGDRVIAGPVITMPVDSGGFVHVYPIG